MLDLRDAEVETVLAWFRRCYEVDTTPNGRLYWRRLALPAEGGVGDQDAWLMNGMEFVSGVQQQVLDDAVKRRRSEQVNG